jgi:hypothetical protein
VVANLLVPRRWLRVYPGRRVLDGNWIEPTEEQVKALAEDKDRIKQIRKRLSNISWMMGALSEYIARRANHEDGTRGRFWQGRFGCREVTSEPGLLVVGIYVDLNERRAGLAATLEESLHSSLGCRLSGRSTVTDWLAPLTLEPGQLGDVPSATGKRSSDKGLLSISLEDYRRLALLTWEQSQRKEPPPPPEDVACELERLGLNPDEFWRAVLDFPGTFRRIAASSCPAAEIAGVRAQARSMRSERSTRSTPRTTARHHKAGRLRTSATSPPAQPALLPGRSRVRHRRGEATARRSHRARCSTEWRRRKSRGSRGGPPQGRQASLAPPTSASGSRS